jgi:8-oxo-dGTP pyrophosphatase MutT (NUDIX family)
MGGGILPTTIYNGKLYFLFGKENKYEKSAPGFSDFGGGTDNNETFLQTAIREGGEELTGFLGSKKDIQKMLHKHGTYNIDYKSGKFSTYRTHIFPYKYNEWLPYYYNNNQRFIQEHLSADIIKSTKIFEKAEIKWVCVDDLKKMRSKFRPYFQNIVDIILREKESIQRFIQLGSKKTTVRKKKVFQKTRKNKK